MPILVALHERGVAARMSTLVEDPLAPALARALRARSLPHAIAQASGLAPDRAGGAILIGDGA